MFHDETRSYFHLPELETAAEQERVIAAALIARMFKDFHCAKRLIKKHKITVEKYAALDTEEICHKSPGGGRGLREQIMAGKLAWEWFKNEPLKRATKKLTLQDCCDVLHLDINQIRDVYLKPSAWRAYCEVENRTKCRPRTNKNYSQFNFERAA